MSFERRFRALGGAPLAAAPSSQELMRIATCLWRRNDLTACGRAIASAMQGSPRGSLCKGPIGPARRRTPMKMKDAFELALFVTLFVLFMWVILFGAAGILGGIIYMLYAAAHLLAPLLNAAALATGFV
jgi:hypothetical protein